MSTKGFTRPGQAPTPARRRAAWLAWGTLAIALVGATTASCSPPTLAASARSRLRCSDTVSNIPEAERIPRTASVTLFGVVPNKGPDTRLSAGTSPRATSLR